LVKGVEQRMGGEKSSWKKGGGREDVCKPCTHHIEKRTTFKKTVQRASATRITKMVKKNKKKHRAGVGFLLGSWSKIEVLE